MQTDLENQHPSAYYSLAQELFSQGKKDEAVFWFYVGQLRYRYHLAVAPNLDPSGDPALFAALSEVVGRPLNAYAFGDISKLAATIDRVLEWDAAHENRFTPRNGHEAALGQIRDGLAGLKDAMLQDQEKIKAERRDNRLE